MYQHPAIEEACIVGTSDAYRGETVKAVIALKADPATAACLPMKAQVCRLAGATARPGARQARGTIVATF
jgi:acyl-coenzyme A synthetase/AMP-(fatty) acid ligase